MNKDEWPGDFIPARKKGATVFNDGGVLYCQGETGEEYLWIEDVPPEYENRC